MIVRRFVKAEHEEHGYIGLKPLWFPGADPITGFGAAHDIMEHPTWRIGSFNNEMMAFGAMLFVRAESGYFSRNSRHESVSRWYQNVGSDFEDMVYRFERGTHDWCTAPAGGAGTRCLDEWAEEEMFLLRGAVRSHIEDVFSDQMPPEWLFDDLRLDWARRWMRMGYRWAAKRYRCPYEALSLFDKAVDHAGQIDKFAEEGDVVVFRVDIANRRVTADVEYPTGDYY